MGYMDLTIYITLGVTFGGLIFAMVFDYLKMDKLSTIFLNIGRFTGMAFILGLAFSSIFQAFAELLK